MTKVFIWC